MSIWKWDQLLEAPPAQHRVSLGEGNTPLIAAKQIGGSLGLEQLWLKIESCNPTGSYKDRFAAAAISHMRAAGKTNCLATSSGNTGSALAAYCAAANIPCRIAIVETAPAGKLVQMLAYGANLLRIKGFGLDPSITEQTLTLLTELGSRDDTALQVSAYCHSPLGMTGVQTLAYELVEQQKDIEHVFVPAGGGGLTLAIAQGFQDLVRDGRLERSPKVHCVQPRGNATIAGPLREKRSNATVVSCTSRISGLQVPIVLDGNEVIEACRRSGGNGFLVSDDEVFAIQRRLAREEGVFCEPAGAVALAGAIQAVESGLVRRHESTVCIVTGSGFKDMASAEAMVSQATCPTIEYSELRDLV